MYATGCCRALPLCGPCITVAVFIPAWFLTNIRVATLNGLLSLMWVGKTLCLLVGATLTMPTWLNRFGLSILTAGVGVLSVRFRRVVGGAVAVAWVCPCPAAEDEAAPDPVAPAELSPSACAAV